MDVRCRTGADAAAWIGFGVATFLGQLVWLALYDWLTRRFEAPAGRGRRVAGVALFLTLLATLAWFALRQQDELRYQRDLDPDARAFRVAGEIRPAITRHVERALAEGIRHFVLDSPGRSAGDGYAIGRALRRAGAVTEVPAGAVCASACVDILLGGERRIVADGSWIGIHRPQYWWWVPEAQRGEGLMEATWLVYVREMGGFEGLVRKGMAVPHEDVMWLERWQIRVWRVETRV